MGSSISTNINTVDVHDGNDITTEIPSETPSSYDGLVAHKLDRPGSKALEALIIAYCLGQLVAYLGAISGQVMSLLSLVGIGEEVAIHECI